MAIDRAMLMKQINDNKERRAAAGGGMNYLKAETTQLRVCEFKAGGKDHFSRPWNTFILAADTKKNVINRATTFGAACAATRLKQMRDEAGAESPFKRQVNRHLVQAYEVDVRGQPVKDAKVSNWLFPVTVWEAIAAYLCTDEWADVLDPKTGHFFTIKKTGKELNTEYEVMISRSPCPIPPEFAKQIKDPYVDSPDPGLEAQCATLGVSIEDLWDNPDELENVESVTGVAAPATKPGAATSNAAPRPGAKPGAVASSKPAPAAPAKPTGTKKPAAAPTLENGWEVGQRVQRDIDGTLYAGAITKINGPQEAEVTFDDGDVMDCPLEELAEEGAADAAEEAAEANEEATVEVGTRVSAVYGSDTYEGVIESVDDDGNAVVKFDDDSQDTLAIADLTVLPNPEPAPEPKKPPFKPGAGKAAVAAVKKK